MLKNKMLALEVYTKLNLWEFQRIKPFFILTNRQKVGGRFRKLLRDIISNPLFLIMAYNQVKGKYRVYARCFSQYLVKDFLSVKRILNLSFHLKTSMYTWGSSCKKNLVSVKNKNFFFRGSFCDSIVQQAIFFVLNNLYEKKLNLFNLGKRDFRLSRSCHSVLKEFKFGWRGVSWFLEFDISQKFRLINRNILMSYLTMYIQDDPLISLLFKLYNSKVWSDCGFLEKSKLGTWEGTLLSPLLLNIYLISLDYFIESLRLKFECGFGLEISPLFLQAIRISNKDWQFLSRTALHFLKLKKICEAKRKNISRTIRKNWLVRIKYIRFRDSFLIGIVGCKRFARRILKIVSVFLTGRLQLVLNLEKTKIINSYNDRICFLGTFLYCSNEKKGDKGKVRVLEKRSRLLKRVKRKVSFINESLSKVLSDNLWKCFQLIVTNYVKNLKLNGSSCNIKVQIKRRLGFRLWSYFLLAKGQRACKNIGFPELLQLQQFPLLLNKTISNSFFNQRLKRVFLILTYLDRLSKEVSELRSVVCFNEGGGVSRKKCIVILYPIIKADVSFIYKKFQKIGILNTRKKPCRNLLLLSLSDLEIIKYYRSLAVDFLSYYCCCDNFMHIKFLVSYYMRMSLVLTLKQKHKLCSILQVFQIYGASITKYDYIKKCEVSFFSLHSIKLVVKRFLLYTRLDPFLSI